METWMNQTWWLYDLTILAILFLCIWNGWQRGIIHTILRVLCYTTALLLANLVADPISVAVYDAFLAEPCSQWLETELTENRVGESMQRTLENYGISLDDTQLKALIEQPDTAAETLCESVGISNDLLNQTILPALDQVATSSYIGLPDWMSDALLGTNDTTSEQANQLISMAALLLSSDTEAAANSLTETYMKPVVTSFLKVFVFFLAFLLISATMRVIIKVLSRASKGRLATLNRLLGAGLGCCQATLFMYLLKILTAWLVESGSNQLAFFNETVIEKTILFQNLLW